MTDKARQIQAMKDLGFTQEEIADVLQYDAQVDKGKIPIPLTKEQKEVEKKMRATGSRVVYELDNSGGKRSKKEDLPKAEIIQKLIDFLSNDSAFENIVALNPERMIRFTCGESDFDLTLIRKNKGKKQ